MTDFFDNPIVRGVFRTLASILIATAFLVALMVASAQQQVMMSLKKNDPDMSYSSARQIVKEYNDNINSRSNEKSNSVKYKFEKNTISTQIREINARYINLVDQVFEINNDLARRGLCSLSVQNLADLPQAESGSNSTAAVGDSGEADAATPATAPQPPATSPVVAWFDDSAVSRIWREVYSCRFDPKISDGRKSEIETLGNPQDGFLATFNKYNSLLIQRAATDDKFSEVSEQLERLESEIAAKRAIIESYRDVEVLNNNPIVSVLSITSLPPALMQIILTFLSGLFGALLLTIILAVYPNNQFKFTQSHSYWSRILLGGLIAVGVFVVIGGGVTVLGSSQGLFDGEANFMSFCAIGMLAGMFSDRVAQWMSARADMFVDTTRLTEDDQAIAAAAAQAGAEGIAVAPADAVTATDPAAPAEPQARG